MADAEKSRFNVTADDLRKCDWQTKLATVPDRKIWAYVMAFVDAGKECTANEDPVGQNVYALLNTVASFHANFDAQGNPFGPMWSGIDGKRSLNAEDLAPGDLDALAGILEEISDADFQARVGDVLWESRKGQFKAARVAVKAYLTSAQILKTEGIWSPFAERLDRAAQLSAKVGFGKPLHQETIALIEATIEEFRANPKAGLLCHALICVLLEHGAPRPEHYATISEQLATDFATVKNGEFAHTYWKIAEKLWRIAKQPSDEKRCALSAAECLIASAEGIIAEKGSGYLNAAQLMARALQELRKAQAPQSRKDQIHLRLIELERMSLGELSPMELKIDEIPGFRDSEANAQKVARAHVQGRGFEEAVERLVRITRPTDLDALKKQVADESGEFIFYKIMGSSTLDHSGKVTDTLPPEPRAVDVDGMDFEKRMFQTAKMIQWQMRVVWWIEPARMVIHSEHPIRRRDLMFLVANNPFIPPNHQGIYLRGIQSGFSGDWLVAMHLLIPQLEASLRYVLHQYNVVTTSMAPDRTQKDLTLNELFKLPKLEEIFGPETVFDLRGLLVEDFGHNIRNKSAHGLMPEAAFYQPACVLVWWMALHLCWIGYLAIHPENDTTQGAA